MDSHIFIDPEKEVIAKELLQASMQDKAEAVFVPSQAIATSIVLLKGVFNYGC